MAALKAVQASKSKSMAKMDTLIITPESCQEWKRPLFQRPVKENAKVLALAEEMKRDGGVWPGIVTLGALGRDVFIIDGQHRRHAFILSGLKEGIADVRTHSFTSMAEMGEEFVRLNSQLVKLNPDDILRGLEGSIESLRLIREKCPFVGYDSIRRNGTAPVLSMSVALRCWHASSSEVPMLNTSSTSIAQTIQHESAEQLVNLLNLFAGSFGRDPEYYRLWGAPNLTMCAWIYRRMVLAQGVSSYSRWSVIKADEFKRCLMSLSASHDYVDWLVGRSVTDRDRSPIFSRIRRLFIQRLEQERSTKVLFIQPSWLSSISGARK